MAAGESLKKVFFYEGLPPSRGVGKMQESFLQVVQRRPV